MKQIAIALLLIATGCGTIAPKPVAAKVETDSHFLGYVTVSGIQFGWIDEADRERFNALVKKYGQQLPDQIASPDTGLTRRPDGTWLISHDSMLAFVEMATWERSGK